MISHLPTKVCALDLETERTSFKTPEKSKLLFVGILPYTLKGSRYFPGRYRYFLPHQIRELEAFLKSFPGIIIGHNILHFDYRVLRPFFSLNGIPEKTVDTLLFLHRKSSDQFSGLSLKSLAQRNLKRLRKMYLSGSIQKMWRSRYRQKVIEYNKMDCRLTMALWSKMVLKKKMDVPYVQTNVGLVLGGSINVTLNDLRYLLGRSKRQSFKSWEAGINKNESRLNKAIVVYTVYYWRYCSQCRRTYLFEFQACSEAFDESPINCPECETQYGTIPSEKEPKLVGSVEENLGKGTSLYIARERKYQHIPEQFQNLVLQHLQSTGRRRDRVAFMRDWKPPAQLYMLSTQDGDQIYLQLHWIYCDRCDKTILFEEQTRSRRSKKFSMLRCPRCRTLFETLFKTRSRTARYVFIGELNGIVDSSRAGASSGTVKEEFLGLVLKYIGSRRKLDQIVVEDLCDPF